MPSAACSAPTAGCRRSSETGDRRADTEADDRLLADRRVDDATLPELLLQAAVGAEHAAEGTDVFARTEDRFVLAHTKADGLVKGHHVGEIPDFTHVDATALLVVCRTVVGELTITPPLCLLSAGPLLVS